MHVTKLAVVSIFNNESHIIEEWIEHYLNEGVDKLFLIDNGSTDDYIEKIQKYITDGRVVLNIDNTHYRQVQLLNKYYLESVKKYDWIIVVNMDEFIYSRKGFKTIKCYLKTLNTCVQQVYIPWKMFGSNNIIKQPDSIIQNFTARMNYEEETAKNGKCITRTSKIKHIGLHYSMLTCDELLEITSDHNIQTNSHKVAINISEKILENSCLHLNHYITQSWEWFNNVKMQRGHSEHMKHHIHPRVHELVDSKVAGVPKKVHFEISNSIHVGNSYFTSYDTNETTDEELKEKQSLV
jgi:glycosyltransferase involved in cell wall biosynthesis